MHCISDELNVEQQNLENELQEFQKSIVFLESAKEKVTNKISMRKENVKFHEFCLKNDISPSDKYGDWNQKEHQKYVQF